jgi:transposase-like protein
MSRNGKLPDHFTVCFGDYLDSARLLYDLLVGKITKWPEDPAEWKTELRGPILRHLDDMRKGYVVLIEVIRKRVASLMDGDTPPGNRWSVRCIGVMTHLAQMAGCGDYDTDYAKLRYLGVLARDPLLLHLLMQGVYDASKCFGELVAAGDGRMPLRNRNWERDAIIEAYEHPEKTSKQIAATVGVNRTTLSESAIFKNLRQLQVTGQISVKDPDRKGPRSRSARLIRDKVRNKQTD